MTLQKFAIRIVVLTLPLCAGASAMTAVSDPADEQIGGARTGGSVPSTWSEPSTSVVEVTIPPAAPSPPVERLLSANPLWAMPVKQFSVTRERPIFLPSRRPPAPPAPAVTVATVVNPPRPNEPEPPRLSLVGTIVSDEDQFGIFVDQATKAVLRLRVGEDFQGWKLQSVRGREVAFQKNQQSFVVALPLPALSKPSIAVREEPGDTWLEPVNVRHRRGSRQ